MDRTTEAFVAVGYPPEQHLLRDLALETENRPDDTASCHLPVVAEVLGEDGTVRAGVLALLVDAVGGGVAARVVRPDWMATADLSLHLLTPVSEGTVEGRAHALRAGRTTAVIEVGLYARPSATAPEQHVGIATMTFSVLPRRDSNPVMHDLVDPERTAWATPDSGFTRDVYETVGLHVVDAADGIVEAPITEYSRNSLGALQGGALAMLVDCSAAAALGVASGSPMHSRDFQVTYLALGRTGPMQAATTVLACNSAYGTAHVEVVDTADGRVATVARVVATAGWIR